MPFILNIETSSTTCTVCLARDGILMDYKEDQQGNSHARVLTMFIQALFKEHNLTLNDLDAVAVSAGPGSYTGLRIGTSVAKGICYALNKPLIAVPTLLSMALGMREKANQPGSFYMPALDARRMDIYTAVFDEEGNECISTRAATVNEALIQQIEPFGKVFVSGSGAEKCKSAFTSSAVHFLPGINCDARLLIPIAEDRAKNIRFEDLAYFEPHYLKEFGAKT